MKKLTIIITLCIVTLSAFAQNYKTAKDIVYHSKNETDEYRKERCKLDIYYPTGKKNVPTLIIFHGGGLESGNKQIPEHLKENDIVVVAPNYRLSPRATHPAYIDDAAMAVSWVMENIKEYGGSTDKIYVSGHSAGGYLTLMLALDKSYLQQYGVDADSIAGYFPISGQTNTHYTIRKERGQSQTLPFIDEYAPLSHARKLPMPMLLITGQREKELLARYSENLHLYDILKGVGNDQNITLYELQGFDHGTMLTPSLFLILETINKQEKAK